MSKYIDAEKLIELVKEWRSKQMGFAWDAVNKVLKIITSFQQEQPDTCIFGNTPSEEACKFCGVDCELREPKQSGITSTNLSSTNEAVGLAIMAYLDTKVKHDNAKVCGVSLRVAREWIREKIANKQEQPEVDLEKAAEQFARLYDNGTCDGIAQDCFIAGAKWQKEQMIKEAVAVEVVGENRDLRLIDSTQRCLFNAKRGDWLKIILVKEDEI